ncbi:M15 family metallopeptidase [Dokdonella soli]|uniref:D-alanyl-D-alanine carboxypeptidase-like core domain-containing protein n=1 Tax=Dokdonella soli TaxID=529810 RepID=A0ABN1IBD1_9GAMM
MNEALPEPPRRCDALALHTILRETRALGVPADYARSRNVRAVREPRELAYIGRDVHDRAQWLTPRAARAFARMHTAAIASGIELQLVSAFRSAEYQLGILKRKLERGQSIVEILRVSAAPGYSEHHSGRALDLTAPGYAALEEEFEHSPAFAWLREHARRFGFALSYPRGNPHGIAYEPWHWCWHSPRKALRRP